MLPLSIRQSKRDLERNADNTSIDINATNPKDERKRKPTKPAFLSLDEGINGLCEFIKERRKVHQNIKVLIGAIKLFDIRALEEKNSQASS